MKAFFSSIFITVFPALIFSGCQREFILNLPASGTLKDAQGLCMPAQVHGTFYNGLIPGKDTAYIEVQVNVFTVGIYSIFTNIQNGLRFADSGLFNHTGLHIIKLKPSGIPEAPVGSVFTICFDSSCCSFQLEVNSNKNVLDTLNTWRYTDTKNNVIYMGSINATYFLITPIVALLSLRKEVTQANDTTFEINLAFPNKNIITGIFGTDSLNGIALSTKGICINCAWDVMYKLYGVKSTIVVTSYNPATKIIKGTFSGTTIDLQNQISSIKDGSFSAVVEK